MNESEHQPQSSPEEEQESEPYYDQGEGYSPSVMLFGEELKQALLEEFNLIFSKEYITTDPYLLYNMNADFFAPISVIEDLPQIKALTYDTSVILQVLRECDKVQVDEVNNLVKPTCNLTQRNTIIIRDVPANVPKEEILELFGNDEKFLSAIVETKYEYGDNYFIKFSNENVTLEALSYLRDRSFRGKPVQARIKSENLRKSFYYNVPSTSSYYYNGNNPYGDTPSSNGDSRGYKGNQRSHDPKSPKGGRFGGNRRRGEPKVRRGRPPSKKNAPHEKNEHKPHSAFSMSTSHWPPLPVPSTSEEGKKLVAGYPGDFTKYNKDQFVSIICALNNNPNPKFETGDSPAVLENGQIHSDLEILKPIPNGAVVEFIEAKQKNKSKGHKNPTKNDSPGTHPSSGLSAAGIIQPPSADPKESSESPITPTPTPMVTPSNPPATVWPAIDSSSVKTPPPPNHQTNKKPPPPKQQRKPPATAPVTPNDKATHGSAAHPSHAKAPTTGQKSKPTQGDPTLQQQPQQPPKSKHYPAKHQKKPHSEQQGHSGHVKADHGPQKTTEKENVVQTSSQGKDAGAVQSQAPREKSDRSYADIARSTTPTNTPPSNTAVSD